MPYLTATEIRDKARSEDLRNTDLFSDADLEDLVAEFEEIAEDYCGVAFIPRTVTEVVTMTCSDVVILQPKITAVSALTIDGTASTAYSIDDASNAAAGLLILDSRTTGDVSVTYTHGFATLPATVSRACVQYVRACALRDDSNVTRDVISVGFEGGSTRYSTPDPAAGRPTGYIEVDRLLNSTGWRRPPGIA